MRILAFDTSTPRGSVALLQGRDVVAEMRIDSLETHSARLLRSIEFLLESTHWSAREVELIAVGKGPGSFTGIRIGVATGMGLAQALGISFAGVSGLEAHAFGAAIDGRIGVILDAQRSQVYYAEYDRKEARVRRAKRPALWHPEDLERHLAKRHLYLVGDGALRYAHELNISKRKWPRLLENDSFLAANIGRLAHARRESWRSGPFIQAEPLYIRPPDAMKAKGQ